MERRVSANGQSVLESVRHARAMTAISLTCVPEAVFDERVDLEVVVDKLVGGRFGDSDFTEPLYSEAPD